MHVDRNMLAGTASSGGGFHELLHQQPANPAGFSSSGGMQFLVSVAMSQPLA